MRQRKPKSFLLVDSGAYCFSSWGGVVIYIEKLVQTTSFAQTKTFAQTRTFALTMNFAPVDSDWRQPTRIDNAIRVGRPESTQRFESADLNRRSDSSRPTRIDTNLRRHTCIDTAIQAGRRESPQRLKSADVNRLIASSRRA